jgi:hypothetical protein
MARDASFSHPIPVCKQPMQVSRKQIHAAKCGSELNQGLQWRTTFVILTALNMIS